MQGKSVAYWFAILDITLPITRDLIDRDNGRRDQVSAVLKSPGMTVSFRPRAFKDARATVRGETVVFMVMPALEANPLRTGPGALANTSMLAALSSTDNASAND